MSFSLGEGEGEGFKPIFHDISVFESRVSPSLWATQETVQGTTIGLGHHFTISIQTAPLPFVLKGGLNLKIPVSYVS